MKRFITIGLAFSLARIGLPDVANLTPVDGAQAAENARKEYIDRFIKFTQDRNVSGRAKDPKGNTVQGGEKSRFNRDDGNSFQSDLTYHDASYTTFEDDPNSKNKSGTPTQVKINPFVSAHGGISAGDGSSLLERTVYEKHKEFSKNQNQQNAPPPQPGIKNESIFREETVQVTPDPKNPDQPEEVKRVTLLPEVKTAVEQVGQEAFKTVEKAAKTPDAANDPQVMGNSVFYREAIARASKALWDSTLANLSQRRLRLNGGAETAESVASCEASAQTRIQDINNDPNLGPNDKKDKINNVNQNLQRCQQMAQVKWSAIDPTIDSGTSQGGPQIKEKGINGEDPYERDLRNQLEVMDKVGVSQDSLKSNWKYSPQEFQNEILVETDDSGNVSTAPMTNAEQLEAYNQSLDEAIESLRQAKQVMPDLNFNEEAIQAKKIQPGQKNILEINQVPEHVMNELNGTPTSVQGAKNYTELLKEQTSNQ